jgi:hypothetical protein
MRLDARRKNVSVPGGRRARREVRRSAVEQPEPYARRSGGERGRAEPFVLEKVAVGRNDRFSAGGIRQGEEIVIGRIAKRRRWVERIGQHNRERAQRPNKCARLVFADTIPEVAAGEPVANLA